MLIYDNGQPIYNNSNNNIGCKVLKLPIKKMKIQSRNSNINNGLTKEVYKKKNSLYSTKEATPRKEYNQFPTHTSSKSNYNPSKELDDSLSQISQILNKADLNYSGMVGKIPGINEESNFVYNQMLFNKSHINKAKILSHKIGVLKLPISKISSKEALSNSDREKKCFSDRIQGSEKINENKNSKKNVEESVDISCCFFGGK